jgi:predicted dehydrogenase
MDSKWRRRDLLALCALSSVRPGPAQQKPVRIGVIGTGSRGTGLVRTLLDVEGVEIPALCDINEANLMRACSVVEKAGRKRPEGYQDYLRLVGREDLDAVIVATPWDLHARMSIAAMRAGKYVGSEVPAAITLEECWELVETCEQTGKPCMLLENVCCFRNVLAVLNLVEQGVLGELTHCEGGYQHDVRSLYVLPGGELTWRGMAPLKYNGNLYPTHPIGPIAWWTKINRGNRFTYLTSMSSHARGARNYVAKRFGADRPNTRREYRLGDVNTSLIKTASGLTVTLYYDVQSPRPYDLIFRVQGTQGIYSGSQDKIYIEDRSPKPHAWEDATPYYEQYEHPLWKRLGRVAARHGHGGADYITLHEFVRAVRNRTPPPIDVYDAAAWSAIVPLSARSVEQNSAPQQFPDFTRGRWKQPRALDLGA